MRSMAAGDGDVSFGAILRSLEAVIEARRDADPAESHVAGLLQGPDDRLLKKIGEEAIEVVLAAGSGEKDAIAAESADLLFHLMVVLARYDLGLKDVFHELESRFGRSGITEKALRSQRDSS